MWEAVLVHVLHMGEGFNMHNIRWYNIKHHHTLPHVSSTQLYVASSVSPDLAQPLQLVLSFCVLKMSTQIPLLAASSRFAEF